MNYVHVLQSILRLREISAHGSELDNASELSWSGKDRYQIFQLMCDANDDYCALCEAKVGTKSAAGSASDGNSPSNKKAAAEIWNRILWRFSCGEYVKPALLDIKSRCGDGSARDLPGKEKRNGRYSGPSTKDPTRISSLLENKKASTAGNPIKRFVYTVTVDPTNFHAKRNIRFLRSTLVPMEPSPVYGDK
ncbi:hypothetical protein B9Z19DRAFT_1120399 [Tuber borchii]|uniref:Uncharacterized protein n=1 Tax=Tuber borchii TaxID=42251 RepID=A0A2T7A4H6_TUBBO|nr:hypothetical protein B9Z19DRAFT_1120399 [Tuber borchii]